jgi:hypothetical protein
MVRWNKFHLEPGYVENSNGVTVFHESPNIGQGEYST